MIRIMKLQKHQLVQKVK